jgi:hypothetical protein
MSKITISNELYDKYLNPNNMSITPNDVKGFNTAYDYVMACESNVKTNAERKKVDKIKRILFNHYEMMRYRRLF